MSEAASALTEVSSRLYSFEETSSSFTSSSSRRLEECLIQRGISSGECKAFFVTSPGQPISSVEPVSMCHSVYAVQSNSGVASWETITAACRQIEEWWTEHPLNSAVVSYCRSSEEALRTAASICFLLANAYTCSIDSRSRTRNNFSEISRAVLRSSNYQPPSPMAPILLPPVSSLNARSKGTMSSSAAQLEKRGSSSAPSALLFPSMPRANSVDEDSIIAAMASAACQQPSLAPSRSSTDLSSIPDRMIISNNNSSSQESSVMAPDAPFAAPSFPPGSSIPLVPLIPPPPSSHHPSLHSRQPSFGASQSQQLPSYTPSGTTPPSFGSLIPPSPSQFSSGLNSNASNNSNNSLPPTPTRASSSSGHNFSYMASHNEGPLIFEVTSSMSRRQSGTFDANHVYAHNSNTPSRAHSRSVSVDEPIRPSSSLIAASSTPSSAATALASAAPQSLSAFPHSAFDLKSGSHHSKDSSPNISPSPSIQDRMSPIEIEIGLDDSVARASAGHKEPSAHSLSFWRYDVMVGGDGAGWKKYFNFALWPFMLSLVYLAGIVVAIGFVLEEANIRRPRHVPLLPDLGYEWIRQIDNTEIPDYFLFGHAIGLIIFVFWHPGRWVLVRRVVFVWGTLMGLRIFTVLATALPDPSPRCAPNVKLEPGVTCGDMIYSGHTMFFVISALVVHHHSSVFFGKLVTWGSALLGSVLIISTRLHYTVDVVLAFIVTLLGWHLYFAFATNATVLQQNFFLRWYEQDALRFGDPYRSASQENYFFSQMLRGWNALGIPGISEIPELTVNTVMSIPQRILMIPQFAVALFSGNLMRSQNAATPADPASGSSSPRGDDHQPPRRRATLC